MWGKVAAQHPPVSLFGQGGFLSSILTYSQQSEWKSCCQLKWKQRTTLYSSMTPEDFSFCSVKYGAGRALGDAGW